MSGQRQAEPGAAADPGQRPCHDGGPSRGPFTPASGIVRREDLEDDPDAPPPWAVVQAYLTRGEHRARVEAHAQRSRAFAEVLEALRNDQEERQEARGRLLPLRRGEK
jgi:hypothetical protein